MIDGGLTIFERVKSLGLNFSYLMTSSIVTLLLGVVTNGLLARGLGAIDLGILVAIQVYGTTVTKIVSFEFWQPVVKFGAEAIKDRAIGELRRIIWVGLMMDMAMAIIGGVVGLVLANFIAKYFGLSAEQSELVWIYCFSIFFTGSGTAMGLLRLYKRFALVSLMQILASVVACAAAIVLFVLNAELITYVIAFAMVNALRSIFVIVAALLKCGSILIHTSNSSSDRSWGEVALRIWRFGRVTWVSSTLGALRSNADIYILGGVFSQAEIGLYAAMKRLAMPIGTLAQHMRVVLFSEYSGIFANSKTNGVREDKGLLGILTLANIIIALIVILAAWVLHDILIKFVFGAEFLPAREIFLVLVAFFAIFFVNGNWVSYLVGRDGPNFLIWMNAGALGITVIGSFVLLNSFDTIAVALANLSGSLFCSLVCVWMLKDELRLVAKDYLLKIAK